MLENSFSTAKNQRQLRRDQKRHSYKISVQIDYSLLQLVIVLDCKATYYLQHMLTLKFFKMVRNREKSEVNLS
jgi:hypothetical protein